MAEGRVVGEVRVKFCGLTRRADAEAAAKAGAAFLGVVLVPQSPRAKKVGEVPALLEGLPASRVLVFADAGLDQVVQAAEIAEASVVQLHGNESPEMASRLREAGPWSVWKSVRVKGPERARRDITRFRDSVDGILLDTWHPHRLGGTGTPFSWDDLADVRQRFPDHLRFILAGGLRPENIQRAIAALSPDIVDVSSGVEREPGVKDPILMEALMTMVRGEGKGGLP